MDNPPDFMALWDYQDQPPLPCVFTPFFPKRAPPPTCDSNWSC